MTKERPSIDGKAAGKPYEPQSWIRLRVTKPLCRDSGSVLILEGTHHHGNDHADRAKKSNRGKDIHVVETPDLRRQQADARNDPDVVVNAAAQRTKRADGVQRLGDE